jgi:hypothetical protein
MGDEILCRIFVQKSNPLLNEVETINLADLERGHQNQRKKSETRKIFLTEIQNGGWKMRYTGTDGKRRNIVHNEAL